MPTEYTYAGRYHNLPDAQKRGRDIQIPQAIDKKQVAGTEGIFLLSASSSLGSEQKTVEQNQG